MREGGSLNSSFEDPSNTLIALLYINGIVKSWSQENWLVSIKQSFPKFYSSIKFGFKCVLSKEPSTMIGHISKCNFLNFFISKDLLVSCPTVVVFFLLTICLNSTFFLSTLCVSDFFEEALWWHRPVNNHIEEWRCVLTRAHNLWNFGCRAIKMAIILPTGQWYAPSAVPSVILCYTLLYSALL